jgi:hypothetical protein
MQSFMRIEGRNEGPPGAEASFPVYYGTLAAEMYTKHVAQSLERYPEGDDFGTVRLIDKVQFTKSAEWSHECEHRFVQFPRPDQEKAIGAAFPFQPADIESIVFGIKTSAEDERAIRRLVAVNGWNHVTFWKAQRGSGWAEIQVIPAQVPGM